jgi:hypothetical protein
MATSSSTGRAWVDLIQSKRFAFKSHDCVLSESVVDEDSFRDRFERLCRPLKQYLYTVLISRMRAGPIVILAQAIDSSLGLAGVDSSSAIVLSGLLAVFKVWIPLTQVLDCSVVDRLESMVSRSICSLNISQTCSVSSIMRSP